MPSITERLQQTFRARTKLGPFTTAELDAVQVFGRAGLVRLPQGPAEGTGAAGRVAEPSLRRLEEKGFLRPGGPRPDEPPRDQVPATLGPDREPVTLLGDYAIVQALRGSPSTVTELRLHVRPNRLEQVIRVYAATKPAVMLQEVPLEDGRLAFLLYRADEGLLGVAGACGVEGDTLKAVTPPTPAEVPAAEAHQRWDEWTDVRVARPEGQKVNLTTFMVGRDRDGLWIVEPPYDSATAVWHHPDGVGERLSELLSPSPGAASWLPDDPAE